jgi:hypothetical protein
MPVLKGAILSRLTALKDYRPSRLACFTEFAIQNLWNRHAGSGHRAASAKIDKVPIDTFGL